MQEKVEVWSSDGGGAHPGDDWASPSAHALDRLEERLVGEVVETLIPVGEEVIGDAEPVLQTQDVVPRLQLERIVGRHVDELRSTVRRRHDAHVDRNRDTGRPSAQIQVARTRFGIVTALAPLARHVVAQAETLVVLVAMERRVADEMRVTGRIHVLSPISGCAGSTIQHPSTSSCRGSTT